MFEIEIELNKFWKWSKMSNVEYSQTPDYGNWETEYDEWDDIYNAVSKTILLINQKKEENKLCNFLLDAIAIDNENGIVIRKCEIELYSLKKLYAISVNHMQPEARRQISESIGKREDMDGLNYLRELVNDENKYVQRSALISLKKLDITQAEQIALKKIFDDDEYIRLFSVQLLKEISSKKLLEIAELLKDDKSEFIQYEVKHIRHGEGSCT